jgi:hypothetical protein
MFVICYYKDVKSLTMIGNSQCMMASWLGHLPPIERNKMVQNYLVILAFHLLPKNKPWFSGPNLTLILMLTLPFSCMLRELTSKAKNWRSLMFVICYYKNVKCLTMIVNSQYMMASWLGHFIPLMSPIKMVLQGTLTVGEGIVQLTSSLR